MPTIRTSEQELRDEIDALNERIEGLEGDLRDAEADVEHETRRAEDAESELLSLDRELERRTLLDVSGLSYATIERLKDFAIFADNEHKPELAQLFRVLAEYGGTCDGVTLLAGREDE